MSDGVERDVTAVNVMVEIGKLWPHKMNVVIYGEEDLDEHLVSSVAEHGIIEPLLVEDQYPNGFRIISGHRRYRAALAENLSEIPCRVIPPLNDDIAETEMIVEANRQREKTFLQLMNEAAQLERIESEKAKRRQGTRTDLVETLPQSETGKTRDKVAEKVGMSGRTYDKAKGVLKAAAAGNETAKEQVEKLEKGEVTITRAFNEVQMAQPALRVDYILESEDARAGHNRFRGLSETEVLKDAYAWLKSMKNSGIVLKRLTIDGNKDVPIDEFLRIIGAEPGEFSASEKPEKVFPGYPEKKAPGWHNLQVDYTLPNYKAYQSRTSHFGGYSESEVLQKAYDKMAPSALGDSSLEDHIILDRLILDETEIPVDEFLRRMGAPIPVEESMDQKVEDLKPDEEPKPEPTPVPLTPIVYVSNPESKQHSMSIWYQSKDMEKAERSPFYGPLTPEGYLDGVIRQDTDPGMAVRVLEWMEMVREKYAFPRLRFDKEDITLEDLRALALWGRIPEEQQHTITPHYMGDNLPAVTFFAGPPAVAAQKAMRWLAGYDGKIRRIHYCDGAGASMDVSTTGLGYLARTNESETKKDREKNAKFAQKILLEDFVGYLYGAGFHVADATEAFSKEDILALVESYLEDRP